MLRKILIVSTFLCLLPLTSIASEEKAAFDELEDVVTQTSLATENRMALENTKPAKPSPPAKLSSWEIEAGFAGYDIKRVYESNGFSDEVSYATQNLTLGLNHFLNEDIALGIRAFLDQSGGMHHSLEDTAFTIGATYAPLHGRITPGYELAMGGEAGGMNRPHYDVQGKDYATFQGNLVNLRDNLGYVAVLGKLTLARHFTVKSEGVWLTDNTLMAIGTVGYRF